MRPPARIASLAAALLVSSCSAVSTSFDYDVGADFARLQTYAWVPVEHDEETISELVLKRVESSVHDVLTAKGYRRVADDPDFFIHTHVSRRERTRVTEHGPRYDYRGWAGYDVEVYSYEEGTLILDVEDAATDALIWRGTARRAINTSWTPEQITERVREAVETVLAEFPPPAEG